MLAILYSDELCLFVFIYNMTEPINSGHFLIPLYCWKEWIYSAITLLFPFVISDTMSLVYINNQKHTLTLDHEWWAKPTIVKQNGLWLISDCVTVVGKRDLYYTYMCLFQGKPFSDPGERVKWWHLVPFLFKWLNSIYRMTTAQW
jgi:hypothetical protein